MMEGGEKYGSGTGLSQKTGESEAGLKLEQNALDKSTDCLGINSPEKIWVEEDIQYLRATLESAFEPIGLEVHPFLVGWYNEKVSPKFQYELPKDTLAFVVISGPQMFEKCIIPYVKARFEECPDFQSDDLMNDSVKHACTIVASDLKFEGLETEVVYDFDLLPSRRPKVLVQTAAHVAGAVQYLHKDKLPTDILEDRFTKKSNLNGVAIHPKHGGWYAIRGVMFFKNVQLAEDCVRRPEPVELFSDPNQIARVIELFAYEWQTNEWRDSHQGPGLKYSSDFITYLSMEPSNRWEFVKRRCLEEDDDLVINSS